MKPNHRFTVIVFCSIALFAHEMVCADDALTSADVTKLVQQAVKGNALTIKADTVVLGDPAPDIHKRLKVEYTVNGAADSKVVMEGVTLEVHPPKGTKLVVTKAVYGDLQSERKVDVTKALTDAVQGDKLNFAVNNEILGGDPASTTVKTLEVSYTIDGKPGKATAGEFETLVLPPSVDSTGKLVIVSATYGAF